MYSSGTGSVGTREEIFSFACKVDDCVYRQLSPIPMIFFDETFWKSNGIFELVHKLADGKSYQDSIICTGTYSAQHLFTATALR
jgi:predicted Rossmann-fold nucleotide-binding protein